MDREFKASFIQFDITPNVSATNPAYLQGMAGPARLATEIEKPLCLQMVLLEDANFTKMLFITADIIGFDRSIVYPVRKFADAWGIKPEGIILNASHTHYAPGTVSNMPVAMGPFYQNYNNEILQMIQQNLSHLYGGMEACDIHVGKADVKIGANRRLKVDGKVNFAPNMMGEYLEATPFMKIVLQKTKRTILLVNHGCHPTGLGDNTRISTDYPGYMREWLTKRKIADHVLFLQGAGGSSKETALREEKLEFSHTSRDAAENGKKLAMAVADAAKEPLKPVHGDLFCIHQKIYLPLKQAPASELLRQIIKTSEKTAVLRQWAESLLKNYPTGTFPDRLPMEIQLVSIGDDVNMITFPAEPVAELAGEIKSLAGISNHDFILGYTNGLEGYLPTDKMIHDGGYETEQSHIVYQQPSGLDTGVQGKILQSVEFCLDQKQSKDKPNGYGRYHLTDGDKRAFFVMSAGRCGTMTLAHLLNTAGNAHVWHHPQPDPLKESLLAYWGEIDKRRAFWKARYSIIHKTWSEGLIHGETDLLMTPFCDMLPNEIPDAKFIILVRDPRDFVRSGMRRNYYYGHPWDPGRLRPQNNTEGFEQWKKLDQFGKICWLWNKTYENINQMLSRIGNDRVITVRFEDLVAGIDETKRIFDFMGLEGFDDRKIQELISHKFNAQTGGSFPKPQNWSGQFNETLWNLCGPAAEQFGYSRQYKKVGSTKPSSKVETTSSAIRTIGKQPTVSVGLPVYNGGVLLGEAIESILSQDFDNIELVISDNGSTDATQELCLKYQQLDRRVRYHRFEENLGAIKNFLRVLDLSIGPYFMWASYDDLHEKSFVRKCLQKLESDSSIALVYPRTKVLDHQSKLGGIANDKVNANQEDPLKRFQHLICEIGMCNLFYGLYRTEIVRKPRSFYKNLYRGYDNLFLAEIALLGKIVQIEDILFKRRLTRNYTKPLEEQNTDIISMVDPAKLSEGITLPYCRLTYAHIEIINESGLFKSEKNMIFNQILRCFKSRFGRQMVFEIKRAIHLINKGLFFYSWDNKTREKHSYELSDTFDFFHINNLLKSLQEASFIYPERPEVKIAYKTCLEKLSGHQVDNVRKMAFKEE